MQRNSIKESICIPSNVGPGNRQGYSKRMQLGPIAPLGTGTLAWALLATKGIKGLQGWLS